MAELLPSLPRAEVDAAGVLTSYYYAGQPGAPAVVLLHGMSASADSFRELMYALAGDYYLIAPDIPGFGHTGDLQPYTKPALLHWLDAFLETQSVPRAGLLGHSFGGSLALAYAAGRPERIGRMVLLAPSLLAAERFPAWLRRLGQLRLVHWAMGLGTAVTRLNVQRQSRRPFHQPERYDASLWERRAQDYRLARASAASLLAEALHNGREILPLVTQPTAIIWGEDDPVLRPAGAAALATALPHAPTRVFLLPDCGHVPMIEQQEMVVAIIRAWFRQ
jgi:pimeloyl-ACP methyl ester carboxylesterase